MSHQILLWVVKWRRRECGWDMWHIWWMRYVYRVFVGGGGGWLRGRNHMKMEVRLGWQDMDWISVAEGRGKW